ncbi:MAG TPA: 16S rRNA (guanine(527)-N(7))-methyltransferase RsmG [Chitinophagaceae bacterium]|nr:16S rRNA (guanine(527)-N(7))-methyltransferase RsmG [Chitinophagaceae bacterium]
MISAGFEILLKYFPSLSILQQKQFAGFAENLTEWNTKINLISRSDVEHLYERHILHSLSIAKIISFKKDTIVMDVGTGGGFPGVPLAIMFPDVKFILVDSIRKKINAVQEICNTIGLKNIQTINDRVEKVDMRCHFVVTRAVATLSEVYSWTKKNIKKESFNDLPNGIICLKGGDLNDEIKKLKIKVTVYELNNFFREEFFLEKKAVHIPCN